MEIHMEMKVGKTVVKWDEVDEDHTVMFTMPALFFVDAEDLERVRSFCEFVTRLAEDEITRKLRAGAR